MYKYARSRMYQKFDRLSPESKARIEASGVLRDRDTVMSGIQDGNAEIIRKDGQINYQKFNALPDDTQNLGFFKRQINKVFPMTQQGQHFANNSFMTRGGGGWGRPPQINITSPNLDDPTTKELARKQVGGLVGRKHVDDTSLKNLSGIFDRHEVYEATDPTGKKYFAGQGQPKGIVYGVPRAGMRTSTHASFGVLARERNLMKGFSYLPEAQDMQNLRKRLGENDVMEHITGKPYSDPRGYTRREVRLASKVDPTTFEGGKLLAKGVPQQFLNPNPEGFSLNKVRGALYKGRVKNFIKKPLNFVKRFL